MSKKKEILGFWHGSLRTKDPMTHAVCTDTYSHSLPPCEGCKKKDEHWIQSTDVKKWKISHSFGSSQLYILDRSPEQILKPTQATTTSNLLNSSIRLALFIPTLAATHPVSVVLRYINKAHLSVGNCVYLSTGIAGSRRQLEC